MKTMAGGSMMGKRIDTTPKEIATEHIPHVVAKTGITFLRIASVCYALPFVQVVQRVRYRRNLSKCFCI
ncbi:MAG: hypothetical protein U5K79_25700 [Cyclobacteriaceae bacterium]|nr:hypothetical protein [Cyclobacteriaceae bacterium]